MHPVLLLAAAAGGLYLLIKKKPVTSSLAQSPGFKPTATPTALGPGSPPKGADWEANLFPAGPYVITTQTDPLNLRQGPSTNTPVLGLLDKGTIVHTDGVVQNGFTGILDGNGIHIGWAALMYLTAADATVTSGFVGNQPMVMNNVALQTQHCLNQIGCRPPVALSGYWDNSTRQCLADFQQQHGLPPTGEADYDTRQILQQYCA
jgi:uncharacterized protein YraI